MIDSEQLDAFLELTERLSFTRVAEARNLTQPAIHLQIQKLSQALDVVLYRRVGRGLEITREGWIVARHAREARERAAQLSAELAGGARAPRIVLAAGEGALRFIAAGALSSVIRSGRVSVTVRTADGPDAAEAVALGRADLAIVAGGDVAPDLTVERITRVPPMVVMRADHALVAKARIRLADLDGVPMVLPPPGRPHRARIADAMRARGFALAVALEVGGWDAMADFAGMGLGVAIINGCVTVPRRLVTRPLVGLEAVEYQLVRRGAGGSADVLADAILARKTEWRRRRDTAWARARS